MRRYKYIGPHDAVELHDLDGNMLGTVGRGKTIDVTDTEVADSLDAQDTWRKMPVRGRQPRKPRGRKTAKAAPSKPAKASNPEPAGSDSDEE